MELFYDPTFVVFTAFVAFVALTAKPIGKAVTSALDQRAERIAAELDEAARLREEAQKLLADYKRREADAAGEAEELLAHAREEAKRLRAQAESDLKAVLERRQLSALEKIAQAEAKAIAEVRGQAADLALAATAKLLVSKIDNAKAAGLVEASIAEVKQKLH